MAKLTQKGQARYDQILEKAMWFFNDRGYVNSTMDEIAQACNCDVANLYNYFPSKEHILFGVVKSMVSSAVQMTQDMAKDKTIPAGQRLHNIIFKQLEGRVNLGFTDLYSKYRTNLDPVHAREIVGLRDKYDHLLRCLISEGIKSGEFREINVKLAAICIGAFIERIVVWYSVKGPMSLEEVTDIYCDLLFSGIRSKEPAAKSKPASRVKSGPRVINKNNNHKGK
jgi:AcrR family transcriptional regulator